VARTVRNSKLDSRSARAKLPPRKSGYWIPLQRGFALGYRKGSKGAVWLARLKERDRRHEVTLGSADDALDPDGERTLNYAQAQAKARNWLAALDAAHKEISGPYTVAACLDDYLADYQRRGGKALRTTEIATNALIRPDLGETLVNDLSTQRIRDGTPRWPPPLRASGRAAWLNRKRCDYLTRMTLTPPGGDAPRQTA
jgi:hypothetical protein